MSEYTVWAGHCELFSTLLVATPDSIYVANSKRAEHERARQALQEGRHPEEALPADHVRIERARLREIRHDRAEPFVEFMYGDDPQKPLCRAAALPDRETAAAVAAELAGRMNLSTVPRQTEATVKSITAVPATAAGVLLLMLLIMLIGALTHDPNAQARRYGRAGFFKSLSLTLGPGGIVFVMFAVVIIAAAYWYQQYKNRPITDVYDAPGGGGR